MSAAHGSLHHPSVPNSKPLVSTIFLTPFSLACGLDGMNRHDKHDVADLSNCFKGDKFVCKRKTPANGYFCKSFTAGQRAVDPLAYRQRSAFGPRKVDARGRPVRLDNDDESKGAAESLMGRPSWLRGSQPKKACGAEPLTMLYS